MSSLRVNECLRASADSAVLCAEKPRCPSPQKRNVLSTGQEGPLLPCPGWARARALPHLPLKQAAELENVCGSQHAQHIIHVHFHLAQVEVLQGRGEGWGAAAERESRQLGLCTLRPLLAGALPAGCSSVPGWVGKDALRGNAPARTWAQLQPGLPPSPKESRTKPQKNQLLLKERYLL